MLYLGQFPPALITAFAFTVIFRIASRLILKRYPQPLPLGALSFFASVLLFVLSADNPFTHLGAELAHAVALYLPAQAIASAFDWLRTRRHAAAAD